MKKYVKFKELILKNIDFESFIEKTINNYNFMKDSKEYKFSWGEPNNIQFQYSNSENDNITHEFIIIDTTISYSNNEIVEQKKINCFIIPKNNDLHLIIKGNNEVRAKIRAKLLGKYTNLYTIKEIWKEVDINTPQTSFQPDFLLWLVEKYHKEEVFHMNNLTCKIIDINFISDNGSYMSGIKKRGSGNRLTNDHIIKATLATVDTIDALGIKLHFVNGVVDFILYNNGEFELGEDCNINLPTNISLADENGAEKISYFIKEIIVEGLKNKFEVENNSNRLRELRLEFLIKTIHDFAEVLNITIDDGLVINNNINEIILK